MLNESCLSLLCYALLPTW
uniref:Uncharacterized protein n=1 Tax=Anguilla anguilla TaxID=7936 RepID=A0A0E9UMV3_ANGAN